MADAGPVIAPKVLQDLLLAERASRLLLAIGTRIELWEAYSIARSDAAVLTAEADRVAEGQGGTAAFREKLQSVREGSAALVAYLKQLIPGVLPQPPEPMSVDLSLVFVLTSPQAREKAVRWSANPDASKAEATTLLKIMGRMVEAYRRAMVESRAASAPAAPAPPPPPAAAPVDDLERKLQARIETERRHRTERMSRAKAEASGVVDEAAKAEADRAAKEKAEAEKAAREREEAQRVAEQKAREQAEAEKAERLALVKEEEERLARQKTEEERQVREKAEAQARTEAERKAREEEEKAAAEARAKVEAERIAREKAEAERQAREEGERKAREEAERKAREKAEAEARAKAEEERKAREKAEAERKAREEAERQAREEAERKAREEAERKAREEAERKAREEAERKAREEAERKAREEAERKAREEAERKAREDAERKAREEAERKAREEAERKAREEAERKAREEAERKAREEAERKAREEAERKAREEAERKAREEAERKAREEAERKAREEAERIAREKAEAERKAREEAERIAREKAEAERRAREEEERKAREKAEAERRAREEEERKAREKAEAQQRLREKLDASLSPDQKTARDQARSALREKLPAFLADPWLDQKVGSWFRIKSVVGSDTNYRDLGLRERGKGFTMLGVQECLGGRSEWEKWERTELRQVQSLGQEILEIGGTSVECEVYQLVSKAGQEKLWIALDAPFAGAPVQSESAGRSFLAQKLEAEKVAVGNKEFDCVKAEGEETAGGKKAPAASWWSMAYPLGPVKSTGPSGSTEAVRAGENWNNRPPFPS
jgi:hypothetical protein